MQNNKCQYAVNVTGDAEISKRNQYKHDVL